MKQLLDFEWKKLPIAFGSSLLLIFGSWFLTNVPTINNLSEMVTGTELLLLTFDTSFYRSTVICIMFTVLFFLGLWFIVPNLRATTLIRTKTRGTYLFVEIIPSLLFCALYVAAYEIVSIVCLYILFDKNTLMASGVLKYVLIDGLNLAVYFLKMTGLLFFLKTIFNFKTAAIIIMVWNIVQEMILNRTNLTWYPIKDVGMFSELVTGEIEKQFSIRVSMRMLSIGLILFIATWFAFQKKDILNDEK